VRLLAALALLLFAVPAAAGLPRSDLASVSAAPPAGARLDLSLAAPDIDGRVRRIGEAMAGRDAFLIFADYTCNTLCGTSLQLLADAIERARFDPASYRILVIGLDPKDSAASAAAMRDRAIPAELRTAAIFLLPDQQTIRRAAQALGFRYSYDAANDQFAHPTAVYLIAPDGAVRTTLSPFALAAVDLKQALATAAPAPSLYYRVRLLCYGYDAASGVYTARIGTLLRISGVFAIVLLGSFVLLLVRVRSKAR
jgi:protein SCO1/2